MHVGLREAKRLSLRDPDHFAYEIDPSDHFRNRMFDLDSCVHLDKEKLAGFVIIKIFQCSGPAITDMFGKTYRQLAQHLSRYVIDRRRARLLPEFLTPPL